MSDAAPKATEKKKSPVMLIAIVAVVAAAAAGGGAYFFLGKKETGPAKVEEKKLSEHGLVKLEPFVVNLADEGHQRFLRASIQLVVESEEEALEFEEKAVLTMGARSAIVDLLTEQTSEHVASAEGKTALREELKEKVSHALKMEVVDVLFSDFVIQY
ncbi:MAG: flagellar basal body-associated protein FliL [Vicinamibacterales bacterium]